MSRKSPEIQSTIADDGASLTDGLGDGIPLRIMLGSLEAQVLGAPDGISLRTMLGWVDGQLFPDSELLGALNGEALGSS